ncbi:O-methyltransferase, partial [Streptomyces abikoensis]|uniref:O-methyltransferase n=1 Tax=Streptomyces abikoensis TaxID=97398 RepID=UPI0037214922
ALCRGAAPGARAAAPPPPRPRPPPRAGAAPPPPPPPPPPEAGVADRIDLRIAPALDSLRALPAEPHIDLAFLDANKDGYIAYWEELVPRLRPGGLLIVDNVLFFGTVVDPDVIDGPGAAVREFNAHALADKRMESVMLTVADGVTLARRVG